MIFTGSRCIHLLLFSFLFPISLLKTGCTAESKSGQETAETAKILIFTKTEGYRHASIPAGVTAIEKLAKEHNVRSRHTENAAVFTGDTLSGYSVILFLNTTGDILNEEQQNAFRVFIQDGGGFAGIHAAADTEFNWEWYGEMTGAYFDSHPEIQEAAMTVLDKHHPSTSHLPDRWIRTDEWYNYRDISSDINVLLNLEESSYEGGENGEHHPIAWYHDFDGGRVFYTGGGHTAESYSEALFLDHLWGGIEYALGTAP